MKLTANSAAVQEGRTVFVKKVFDVTKYHSNIIKSADHNIKLGKGKYKIKKGRWKGLPMFSLTLEERKTCPFTCQHWTDCYGNGMNYGHRFKADKNLIPRIKYELEQLSQRYPKGFVIRLHILGDFYSLEYVGAWESFLEQYLGLRIFGYTAHTSGPMYIKISNLRRRFGDRVWLRYSKNAAHNDKAPNIMYAVGQEFKGTSFTCPEILGKTESCLTCAACFQTKKSVKFLDH